MKKNLLITLIFNLVLLVFFIEIFGQVLKRNYLFNYYESRKIEKSILIKNKNYLNFVNHFRDQDYKAKGDDFQFNIKPSNFDEDSIYIYSCYGNCKGDLKNYDLLVQGDSWGELLDRNIDHTVEHLFLQVILRVN